MQNILFNPFTLLPDFSWQTIKSTIQDPANKTSAVFYNKLLFPIGFGAIAGIINSRCIKVTWEILSCAGFDIDIIVKEWSERIITFIDNPLKTVVLDPIYQEVLFRFVIQGAAAWIACKMLPDKKIHLSSHDHIKLATLVAVVVSSLSFGAFQYYNGLGWPSIVAGTISGIVFGTLKEQFGLISSITGHIVTNIDFVLG